jgi:hypothetical protein
MLHDLRLGVEFFAWLTEMDRKLAKWVAAGGCHYCGGRLHQGNYRRKPRGAKVAGSAEGFTLRHSLCCNREGCRRRTLPPSLRFLGRRVYVEAVVLIASVVALLLGGEAPASEVTAVPARTLKRWATWWREIFPQSRTWQEVRALMVPSPAEALLPRSLYERIDQELARGGSARSPGDVCVTAARLLAPCTTLSLPDASRFVRRLSLGQVPGLVTQKMA